jgi:hypothetical protein
MVAHLSCRVIVTRADLILPTDQILRKVMEDLLDKVR